MAVTHTLISTSTVSSSGVNTIVFSSIPNTYTDLVFLGSVRSTSTTSTTNEYDPLLFQFNSSTSGYSAKTIEGTGSTTMSTSQTTRTADTAGGTWGRMQDWGINNALSGTSLFTSFTFYIPNYASSNNKVYSYEYAQERNAVGAYMELDAGVWANSSAITSVSFAVGLTQIAQYSTISLYGIKNS